VILAKKIRCRTYFPRGRNWRFGSACLRLMFAHAGPARRGHTEARPGDESPPHFSQLARNCALASSMLAGRPAARGDPAIRIDVDRDDQNQRSSGRVWRSSYMRPNRLAVLTDDVVELIRVSWEEILERGPVATWKLPSFGKALMADLHMKEQLNLATHMCHMTSSLPGQETPQGEMSGSEAPARFDLPPGHFLGAEMPNYFTRRRGRRLRRRKGCRPPPTIDTSAPGRRMPRSSRPAANAPQ
jgi:hypothetical protein